eukprot:s5760_g6.t4
MASHWLAPLLRCGNGFRRPLQRGPRSFGAFRAFRAGRALSAARDAYTVMGLDRRASQQEVKERFRVLAKQYHPDLNTGDRTASLKMAELTSAYDTLMDPKKRAALDQATAGTSAGAGPGSSYTGGFPYDDSDGWVSPSQMFSEFSDLFGRNSQFRPNMDASAAQRGEDVSTGLDVTFLEAAQGCEKVVSLRLKQVCQDCHGTGAREGTTWSKCRVCRGTGVLRQEKGIFSMGLPCQRRCRSCCKRLQLSGFGIRAGVLDHPCRTCRGESTAMMTRDIRINVPAGVRNLMELRVPGAGHAGSRGGKAGHLFVQVKVLPHERFRQVDDDVHLDVPLTLREALLGAEVSIPNLEGSTERLIIQAPAQPGTTKVLRGRGPPKPGNQGRGHLVLHFLLHLPRSLSPRQVELIEEFDSLAEFSRNAGHGRGSPRTGTLCGLPRALLLSSSALASRESSRPSQGGLLRGEDSGNDGHRAWSERGESDAKDLDVIAKTRQRVREVRERERLERLREEEEKEQRKKDAQAQHEERLRRQEHEKRQRLLDRRVEQESKMAKEAEEKRHDQERRRQQEERAKSLQRQMQARIKAEKERAAKEKRELEQHEKEERRRTEEEAAKRAAEATEAAKKRLAERKKQQDKLRKDEEEASQRAESRESSRNHRELSAQARPARGDSVEVAARRRAEERVRHRSQERRKEEERIRAREALQKCEVEEELRMAKEELEQRRRSAALRAASRQRREKETEERLRQERDEQTAAAKERRLLYRNPKAIAELKASEQQMPLTSEQRRSHSRRRQAEQEKLQRYADGLPVEDSGRPPPLPGANSARVRRGSRSKGERSGAGGGPGGANRLSPSSSLQTEQTGCSETESVLEPLEEPCDEHASDEPTGEPTREPTREPPADQVPQSLPLEPLVVAQMLEVHDELPLTGLPVGKVSGHEGMEVKEDILEVSQVPEELAPPVEEPLEPDELEEVEVESNLSISLHIRI